MTSKVTSLHGGPVPDGAPNEDCVKLLLGLLEAAQSGEISAVIVASHYSDGSTSHAIGGAYKIRPMIGALELLKTRLVRQDLDDE